MYERGWAVGLGLAVTALIAAPAAAVAAKRAEVFEMESVSVLDQQDDTVVGPYSLGAGQMAHCESTPSPAVKKYPKLTSDNPLYGELLIDRNPSNPNEGTRFFFVFDESGEKQQAEGEDAADSQPATTTGSAFAGQTSNANYDLLYFDADGDLDLTNDAVIRPMKDPPVSVRRSPQEAPFETLSMEINLGEGAGTQEMRLLARLRFLGGGNGYAFFMPAEVRKGRIRLGGKEYTATLSQSRVITGRFDRPYTQLQLEPADGSRRLEASPYDRFLGTLRWIDGALCEISASPSGDKLTVGPFRGDAGTIRVDRGGRDIDEEKLAVRGFLESDDRILSLGDMSLPIAVEKLREYEIPVGDYTAVTLVVDYGRVVVDFSENLHSVNDSGFLMSKPPDYEGPTGFVDEPLLRSLLGDDRSAHVFLCGPPPMMKFVSAALRKLGFPRRRIYTERFAF